MVRAILAGTKTQTRRVMTPQPVFDRDRQQWSRTSSRGEARWTGARPQVAALWGLRGECPFGSDGDRLWVRETWTAVDQRGFGARSSRLVDGDDEIRFRADNKATLGEGGCWIPSIYLPRWASRITLEVTEVRVERLQEITAEGARAEGVPTETGLVGAHRALEAFASLWDSISGDGTWASNPWVWVVSFKRTEADRG
jgi:hypothetical protein